MLLFSSFKGTKRKNYNILEEGYPCLQSYHTLIFERSPIDVKQMIERKDILFREHLLPCNRVFKILDKYNNYIVLLRDPKHSYDNYCRLTNNYDQPELLKELKRFYYDYKEYLLAKSNILTIGYDDLILNYNETMDKIKKYWKIKSKIIQLLKEKYTGVGLKRLKDA